LKARTLTSKDIPELLSECPKKMRADPLVHINVMMRPALAKKLHDRSEESGYSQQEIFDMALEAFFK